MPEIRAYQCDSCGAIITKDRDVYRLELKGAAWNEPCPAGGPSDRMQNVKRLGFCEKCARQILTSLKRIDVRSTGHEELR